MAQWARRFVRPHLRYGADRRASQVRSPGRAIPKFTIADNQGVAIATDLGTSLQVRNSILSRNRGGNCQGLAPAALAGRNLQFGAADCPGVSVADPFLDTLYVPAKGSPALTLGDATTCKSAPVDGRDLVFQLRERTTDCALGAYERPPLRALKKPREQPPALTVDGRVPEVMTGFVPTGETGRPARAQH